MTVIAIIFLAVVIVDIFGRDVDMTVIEIFLAGVITGLLALASIVLLRIAMRRSLLRRQEVRELRQQAQRTPASDTAAESRIVDPDDDDAYIRRNRSQAETADTDRTELSPEHRRQ